MNKTEKPLKEILQKNGIVLGFLIFILIVSFLNSSFFTLHNGLTVLRQVSINGLIALGMTFVIIGGGIDLSVGSILAFSSMVYAMLLASGTHVLSAIALLLCIGLLAGATNGAIITLGKVQPFVATLGIMTFLRGATLVLSQGRPVSILNAGALSKNIGQGFFLGIPIPVYILVFVFLVLLFVSYRTVFGRSVYALGGNERASYISGIRIRIVKIAVYALSGLTSALAGLILVSRLSSAQPVLGVGFELDAIAAVVIGGTSLSGGRGSIVGTLIGTLIIGSLNNSLNLLGVPSFYQQMVKGLVILVAVILDSHSKRKHI